MPKGTCSIEGCDEPTRCRGWCATHYQRWRRHGDPHIVKQAHLSGTPYERVMARTERRGDCLIFTGALDRKGYGRIGDGDRLRGAHRVVMECHYGPSDLHVLHSCDTPSCVEIEHLRYGTHSDNMCDMHDRGRHPNDAKNRSECLYGHPWPENMGTSVRGWNFCRACRRR